LGLTKRRLPPTVSRIQRLTVMFSPSEPNTGTEKKQEFW
jgi:hypothetical protein